jgi:tryptophan-rich sensory protein
MSEVHVPPWVFIAVWAIIYSGMGLAAWSLTAQLDKRSSATGVPLAVLCAAFLISLTFWLTNSLRMTATIDAINAILAIMTLWVVSRYSTSAARYLVPYAVWMPITLLIKLVAISRGGA